MNQKLSLYVQKHHKPFIIFGGLILLCILAYFIALQRNAQEAQLNAENAYNGNSGLSPRVLQERQVILNQLVKKSGPPPNAAKQNNITNAVSKQSAASQTTADSLTVEQKMKIVELMSKQ